MKIGLVSGLMMGIVAASVSYAASTGPLVQISSYSPWPAGLCDPNNFSYYFDESEPWVAVNPTNPNNMVTVWQQNRYPTGGGSQGQMAGYTTDGGATWGRVVIPFTRCTGAAPGSAWSYERVTDSWVAFGPDGSVYQAALTFNVNSNDSAISVSKSTNGGATWSTPTSVAVIKRTSWVTVDDKESITVDPFNANNVYVVWVRYNTPPASYRDAKGSDTAKGSAMFSRSTDGGKTWSDPLVITKADEAQGNQIVVMKDGSLLDFYIQTTYDKKSGAVSARRIAYSRSVDNGLTWTGPVAASPDVTYGVAYVPDGSSDIRGGEGEFDVALDSVTGDLHLVWMEAGDAGSVDAFFKAGRMPYVRYVRSTNGGKTWSAPVKVGQAGLEAVDAPRRQQFTPSIAASGGRVAVTFYDFRNTGDDLYPYADYWATTSNDRGATWASDVRLTDWSFDMYAAPYSRGLFLGDYQGLEAIPGGQFVAVFAAAEQELQETSVYSRTFAP